MYICVCNGVTEQQIHDAVKAGAATLAEIGITLGVAAGCGTCQAFAAEALDAALQIRKLPENRAAA